MSISESEIAKFLVTVIKKTVRKNKDELEFLLKGSNRWEKWFQVEFASELIQNDARDVKLEYMSPLDGRKKITNFRAEHNFTTAHLDITFRMKDFTKGKYVGVELKQGNSSKDIQEVFKDIVKIRAIQKSQWPYRSLNFVFLYPEGKRSSKYDRLIETLDKKLKEEEYAPCIDIDFKKYSSMEIAHGLHCFILTWDAGRLQRNMTFEQFHKWLQVVQPVFEEFGVKDVAKGRAKIKTYTDCEKLS